MVSTKSFFLIIIFLSTATFCIGQKKQIKIDSLNEILALQFYEMKWNLCIKTSTKIISLDSTLADVYTARAMSYLNLKDLISPDFRKLNSKKTKHYLALTRLAKTDLEKALSSNGTSLAADKELQGKVQTSLDSCNFILSKYKR